MQRSGRLGLGIVGAGRVGPVLGRGARRSRPRDRRHLRRLRGAAGSAREAMLPDAPILDVPTLVERSELVILAVPDAELPALVAGLAATGTWQPGQIVLHTAPGFGVGVLPAGVRRPARSRSPCIRRSRSPAPASTSRGSPRATSPSRPPRRCCRSRRRSSSRWAASRSSSRRSDRPAYAEAIATATAFSRAIVEQSTGILSGIGVEHPGPFLSSLVRSAVDNALTRASAPSIDPAALLDGRDEPLDPLG